MRKLSTLSSVGYLNLHFTLHQFGQGISYIFSGIFLYQIGVQLWQIYLIWAATFMTRFILRPFAAKFAMEVGLKKTVMFGSAFYSTMYLALGQVQGIDKWLALFVLLVGVTDVLYWLPYHAYFSMVGHIKSRGKETSIRDALRNIAGFLSPLVGGIFINTYGYGPAFVATAAIMIMATIPLYYAPEVEIRKMGFKEALQKIDKKGFWIYAGDGFFTHSSFVWKFVLFLLVLDLTTFGGLLGLAVFLQALGIFAIGKLFDKNKTSRLYKYGLLFAAGAVIGRALFAFSIVEVIALDILFMLGYGIYGPILNSAYYNTSRKSESTLWFQYFAETGWDVGTASAALIGAFMLYQGYDVRATMIFTVAGTLIIMSFLSNYFKNALETEKVPIEK